MNVFHIYVVDVAPRRETEMKGKNKRIGNYRSRKRGKTILRKIILNCIHYSTTKSENYN